MTDEGARRPGTGLRGRPAYALSQLHHALTARLERELAAEGLSLRTHQVLASIDEHGARSQQQVCDSIVVDRSEMVRIVDRLEEAGMLVRRRDRADRRRHRLELTPSGREALQRGERVIEAVTKDSLSRLSESERSTLHALTLLALGERRGEED